MNLFTKFLLFKQTESKLDHTMVKAYWVDIIPQNKAECKDGEREFKCPETKVYLYALHSKGTDTIAVYTHNVIIQGN